MLPVFLYPELPLGHTISENEGAAVADGLVLVYWNDRQHPLSTEVNIIFLKAVFLRDFTQFVPSLQDFLCGTNKPFGLAGCAY